MSSHPYAGLILGIKLSDIKELSIEISTETFEIYNRRGNPTGVFDTERVYKLKYKNKERTINRICLTDFIVLLELDQTIELYNLFDDYSDVELSLDSIILGHKIHSKYYLTDKFFDEIKLNNDDLKLIKANINHQIGYEIEPKLYLYTFYC